MASVPEYPQHSVSAAIPSFNEVIAFSEYLERVKAQPDLAENAHQRIWRMISSQGEVDAAGRPWPFFSRELLGIDTTISRLVDEYLRPAAMGFDVKKRILLLVGPVGGGKSTMVTLIKRGLERFTRTEQGALYMIDGCPMHEEPLHLLPLPLRSALSTRLNLAIEGELCPRCRLMLQETYQGRIENVPVRRIALSESGRLGIGTYAPSDPKSQDIADLVGSMDFQAMSVYGSESDPRAFRFDGELNIANRGVMEFQEMLKLDEKFLYHLLSLSQEGNFKTGRFPLISADELIIGHCNQNEYQTFVQNPRNRALRSRMVVVPVPYNLDVTQEIEIYRKMLAPKTPDSLHLSPSALEMAGTVAVLSRFNEEPKPGGDRLSKLTALQNGEASTTDISAEEGLNGIDPRYVINRLSMILAAHPKGCIDGMEVLEALTRGIVSDPFSDPALREQVVEWARLAKQLMDRRLEADVIRSFALHWHRHLDDLYRNYMDHVVIYVMRETAPDNASGSRRPDETLMQSIEERLGVTENQRPAFREEIYHRWRAAADEKRALSYLDHPGLKSALEQKLFDDLRDEVKITTQSLHPDTNTVKAIERAVKTMVDTGDYCEICAGRAVAYIGELLNR